MRKEQQPRVPGAQVVASMAKPADSIVLLSTCPAMRQSKAILSSGNPASTQASFSGRA
jgi:hypothetical protein